VYIRIHLLYIVSCVNLQRGRIVEGLGLGNLTMSDQKVYVEMEKDANGLEKVVLKEPRGASAQVHLFGEHVTSWKNDRGEELLFVNSRAIFRPPKAIR